MDENVKLRQRLSTELTNQGIIQIIHYPTTKYLVVLNPNDKPEKMNWGDWQLKIKLVAHLNQDFNCPACGEYLLTGHLHHALITRKDVQGMKDSWLIHHSLNCLLLHEGPCHDKATREQCAIWLTELYGEKVEEWYEDFPMKSQKRWIF